ncbi:hypothetical protein [Rhodococcoides kroppenstedtii]|uniref:hypothetical protein n=1 Tax=Rhodococcoides kroppenstedtii TaxID=293050 RepID=UPI001113AD26|nr:hypothetical protein [Rhodococcus kroppenstedtii]
MTPQIYLLSAGIAAVAAILASIITNSMASKREHDAWRREEITTLFASILTEIGEIREETRQRTRTMNEINERIQRLRSYSFQILLLADDKTPEEYLSVLTNMQIAVRKNYSEAKFVNDAELYANVFPDALKWMATAGRRLARRDPGRKFLRRRKDMDVKA